MKLSIITCTYNSEKYLQECIDSVIVQNLDISIYEHVFVDAYSTDNTKKIIEKYKGKYSNVKLIERKSKWVYNAMNEWIKEAKWDYVLCLNSDDYLEKNILYDYLIYIDKTWNKDLYYWKLRLLKKWKIFNISNNNFVNLRKFLFHNLWMNVLIQHPTVLLKKSTFLKLWMFDETKKIASDYWMWLNFLSHKKRYIFYPRIINNFRIHEWSISFSSKNSKIADEECNYFQFKYLPYYKYLLCNFFEKIIKIKNSL